MDTCTIPILPRHPPVCTSMHQSIPVYTSPYQFVLGSPRSAPNSPVFTLTRPACDAVKLGIPYTHRPGIEQPGPPGRATEEACSGMRQPPPRGRRRPSTAAQAAGGPSYREKHTMYTNTSHLKIQTFRHVRTRLQIGGWGSLRRGSVRDSPLVTHSNAFTPRKSYHSRWGFEPHSQRRPQSACVL